MKYFSVCSGIEAASVAWEPLGFQATGFSEIEPFCTALLAERYPHVTNYGDMHGFEKWEIEPFDILVGGTPCQSFSIAGKRTGLDDPRGNLAMVFLAIARKHRPRWIVWENVPGVLSSSGGRDFGAFLGTLGDLGYGWAYRVLDAQFFGVPQRRRRVFVVGCLGDQRSAAEVLFEREGVRGDSAEGGQARQGASAVARAGAQKRGRGGLTHTLGRQCGGAKEDGTGRGSPLVICSDVAPTLLNPKGRGGSNRVPGTCADSAHSLVSVQIARESGQGWRTDDGVAGTVDRHMGASETGSLRAGDQAGQCAPAAARAGAAGGRRVICADVAPTLLNRKGRGGGTRVFGTCADSAHSLVSVQIARESGQGWWTEDSVAGTVDRHMATEGHRAGVIARESGQGWWTGDGVAGTVDRNMGASGTGSLRAGVTAHALTREHDASEDGTGRGTPLTATSQQVRRLTPRECERLQGFPDDWTAITYRGKAAADGPRYAAIGNSMAVPVIRWIGQRIAASSANEERAKR